MYFAQKIEKEVRDVGRPKKAKLDELSLEEQIEHLKMENAILKKAKALRKDYGER